MKTKYVDHVNEISLLNKIVCAPSISFPVRAITNCRLSTKVVLKLTKDIKGCGQGPIKRLNFRIDLVDTSNYNFYTWPIVVFFSGVFSNNTVYHRVSRARLLWPTSFSRPSLPRLNPCTTPVTRNTASTPPPPTLSPTHTTASKPSSVTRNNSKGCIGTTASTYNASLICVTLPTPIF